MPRFVDPTRSNHLCKLHKAIYGLKQFPRAWFQRFSSFLIRTSFIQSQADNSTFVYQDNSLIMALLLYVDDIVLTAVIRQLYIHLFVHWELSSTSRIWGVCIIFLLLMLTTAHILFISLKVHSRSSRTQQSLGL